MSVNCFCLLKCRCLNAYIDACWWIRKCGIPCISPADHHSESFTKCVTKALPLLGASLAGSTSKLYIRFRGFILLRAERGHSVVPPLAFSLQGRTLSRHRCSLGENSLLDPWELNMSKSFLNMLGLSVRWRYSCFIWGELWGERKNPKFLVGMVPLRN